MPQTAAMLDLETMATSPNAFITGIGFAIFELHSPHRLLARYKAAIDLEDPFQAKRDVAPTTIKWWLQQSREAQEAMLTDSTNVKRALEEINRLWIGHQPQTIWAKSPGFDCVIIESMYKELGMKCPWWFSQTRDVRTVEHLAKNKAGIEILPSFNTGTAHNALDDALEQIAVVQWAIELLES